jgi:glycosyltransferase involved in cell wall biosynthesis
VSAYALSGKTDFAAKLRPASHQGERGGAAVQRRLDAIVASGFHLDMDQVPASPATPRRHASSAEEATSTVVESGRRRERAELWFLDDARIHGGGQRFALKLAIGASMRDPPIRCVMVCPGGSELASRSRDAGFEVRHSDYPAVAPPSPRSPAAIFALRRALAAAPRDAIIVANSPRTQAYAAAVRLLSPTMAPIVNVAHEQETAGRPVAMATLRHSGPVVAIGANTAGAYKRALPGVSVRRINNVLDEIQLESASHARARAVRLAVLARMIPEKGILELLDEAAVCSDSWSTLAIGAPPQDRAYETRVRDRIDELGLNGRTHLCGEITDVAGFIDAADVLVVPSTGCEGQPTTIIEALARGIPALVREPILSEDFGGFAVRPYHDASDFGTALRALRPFSASLEDMRRRFGADQAIDGLLAAVGTMVRRDRPILSDHPRPRLLPDAGSPPSRSTVAS